MRADRSLAVVAIGVAVFATACGSNTTPGSPTVAPNPPATSSSSSGQQSNAAPKVPDPLKSQSIAADPCSALNDSQIGSFAGTLKDTRINEVDSGTRYCVWRFQGESGYSLGDVSGGVSGDDGGLGTVYEANAAGRLETFEPIDPIVGYPAVVYDDSAGRAGHCVLAVGLSDKRAYIANVSFYDDHPSFSDPCEPAKKLAGFVVQNLKEGQ